jgi:hypothetical protein
MQVTAKLAAQCLQALQQQQHGASARSDLTAITFNALTLWLTKAADAMQASPGSHAAAAVRQQLQDSALLQHLGPAMDAAAAQLTTAVAALEAAAAAHCSSGAVAYTAVGETAFTQLDDLIWLLPTRSADTYCALLLSAFKKGSLVLSLLSPTVDISIQVIQPAAPAAVHLIYAILTAHGRLSQLSQQQQQLLLPQAVCDFCGEPGKALIMVSEVMLVLASALRGDVPRMLQSCPAADSLLLMREFGACLAIMSLAALLALDTSSSSSSNSSSSGVHRSTGSRRRASRRVQQQQRQASRGGDGSGSGLGAGVRMGSLSPLSRSLFGLLGVSPETMVQLAVQMKSEGDATVRTMGVYMERCRGILKYQVKAVAVVRACITSSSSSRPCHAMPCSALVASTYK